MSKSSTNPISTDKYTASLCLLNQKPLNYDYWDWENILDPVSHSITSHGVIEVCYNEMFKSVPGGPTTAQLLVMFKGKRLNMVEHCGCIFAAPGASLFNNPGGGMIHSKEYEYFEGRRGLYAVTDSSEACVKFGLLFPDEGLGHIVASTQFDPIKVIGVSSGSKIYGYYPHEGVYKRVQTKWGDAKDGSLSAEPTEGGLVSGLTSDGYMFALYGKFDPNSPDPNDRNFNYARFKDDGVKCSSTPAMLDDWTGPFSQLRGTYCPNGENPLWKNTWHSTENGGSTFDQLTGPPANKVCHNCFRGTKHFCLSKYSNFIRSCFTDCPLGPQYKYLWHLHKR
jgi:hypothetical protein